MNKELISRAMERINSSPRLRSRSGEIESILRGSSSLRAGVTVEVERATKGRKAPNGEDYHVKIRASTEAVARDAGIIPLEAWADGGLTNFLRNPVILAYHDYKQPIGISVCTEIDAEGARALVEYWRFHEESDVSRMMKKLYENGYMRAASVGFLVRDFEIIDEKEEARLQEKYGTKDPIFWRAKEAELLETSAVPVPSDPAALSIEHAITNGRAAGIDVTSLRSYSHPETETVDTPAETERTEETPAATPEAATPTIEERVAALETLCADLMSRLAEADSVADSRSTTDSGAESEAPVANPGDEGERSTEASDEAEVEIEVRDGETEEQALDRFIDGIIASKSGAPVEQ
jgi:hypothetical protein